MAGPSGYRVVSLVLCFSLGACATTRAPRIPDGRPTGSNPPHALAASLNTLLETPDARQAVWGVFVRSLTSGTVLYNHYPDRLVMPASTMKLVTLAVAAERLGWDYRYDTELLLSGPVVDGVLRGDLIVRGGGDPTINAEDRPGAPVFEAWAGHLKAAGVTSITGRILGDDDLVEEATPGFGWSWDDLPYGFAAAGGALIHRRNTVRLTVHSGSVAGEDTLVEIDPPTSGLTLLNRVETDVPDADAELVLRRTPDGGIEVWGGIPASASPISRIAAVANPTTFFVHGLKQSLERNGIEVTGVAIDADEIDRRELQSNPTSLINHRSSPLSQVAVTLMHDSQNLYAEALLHALDQRRTPRTATAGREAMREVLESWGIDRSQVVVADASGLSRYNYVTARALVGVLQRMHDDPRHKAAYLASLPVAGQSGTLATRMTGTAAEGNVRAKTGSMSNVRALSGYVTSTDGEPLAFAVLANNFPGPATPVLRVIDQLVDRLARSTRLDTGR